MRRTSLLAFLIAAIVTTSAQAQVGAPGIEYGNTIGGGDGVQLYPYDQQDTWLHGHFQRVPSYGGFASFRPYNYRHVFAQTQLAQQWGHAHGMPYSQQFWNRYRASYLEGNLHSGYQPVMQSPQLPTDPSQAYPHQQYPSQGYATQACPMQAYPMQAYPMQAYPMQAYPMQAYPMQAYPMQAYPAQAYPNVGRPNNAYPVSTVRPIGYQTSNVSAQPAITSESADVPGSTERPIHVFPERTSHR